MLRTALKPRWAALFVLALVLATLMARLGEWQWQRARESSRQQTVRAHAARPAVPLSSLLRPRQSFTNGAADRPVTAEGSWDPAHQLLVADRFLSDRRGWWVLTPLRLPDGSAVAVVRGWTASVPAGAVSSSEATAVTTVTPGQVAVAGVLRPSEPPADREPGAGTGLPDGQLDGVDLTQLVQRWPYQLITGYLVLTQQTPAPTGVAAQLRLVPPSAPGTQSLAWQNVSYAVQWFVFAGFGIFMWWRLVRDDHLGRLRPLGAAAAGPRDTPNRDTQNPVTEPLTDRGAHS